MKTLVKYWHHDREGMIALLILIVVVLLYLTGMALWINYEWYRPVKDWHVHDFAGNVLAAKVGLNIWNKLFKCDKG